MRDFMAMLRTQRFDDYRYYHQSRINQTLHLISAIIFLAAMRFSSAMRRWPDSSAGSRC